MAKKSDAEQRRILTQALTELNAAQYKILEMLAHTDLSNGSEWGDNFKDIIIEIKRYNKDCDGLLDRLHFD